MWWQEAVVYQIYPRSFADANGDGVGDLEGIRQRLDHLVWLGVDAVWLSPIYRSPMADFGYDVSDHCDVDPVFGTLADADALVAEAHERGLKVLLDWVPNHTSIEHPWWHEHPDWYIWRDGAGPDGDTPPNNWVRAFPWPPPLPAWTRDPSDPNGKWYLHLFLPEQPDVDWSEPGLVAAMHDVLRFWLDRGIDGFRCDVAHCLGKDPSFPDDAPAAAEIPHSSTHEHPLTHEHLRGIRRVLDAYDDRIAVGEIFLTGERITERTAAYAGPDQLHLAFDFSPLFSQWGKAERWRTRIERIDAAYAADAGKWPTWVLSNHDNRRHRTRYGSEAAARAAAVLLLTVRATPFLYAGEELGLEDAEIPDERRVDPGGRDGCRAPLPWTRDPGHGWGPDPWLPFPPDAGALSVEAQRDDPSSVLWLYKRLLAARKGSPALRRGSLHLVESPLVAWLRRDPASGDVRGVVVDVDGEGGPVPAELAGWTVEVASDGPAGEGSTVGAEVAPGQALVLRPN